MEKERILELVQQGVLTLDEALTLLEASVDEVSTETEETQVVENPYVDEYQQTLDELAKETEKTNETSESIDELKALIKEREQSLLVINQRLRELEIFKELDELTPEMKKQLDEYTEKRAVHEKELEEYQSKLDEYKKNPEYSDSKYVADDVKQLFNDSVHTAKDFSRTIGEETKKAGRSIKNLTKDIRRHFKMKEIEKGFKVPWLKSSEIERIYEFDAHELKVVDFQLLNGDVSIYTHDKPTIYLHIDAVRYGDMGENQDKTFDTDNHIELVDQTFFVNLTSPKYANEIQLYLPQQMLDQFNLSMTHGVLKMEGIQAIQLKAKHKNGHIDLQALKCEKLVIDTINSDLLLEDNQIEEATIQNVNGDIRIMGSVSKMSLNTAHSNIYVTKTDTDSSDIHINSLAGDVKVAIPEQVGITGDLQTSMGEVYSRLSNASLKSQGKNQQAERTGSSLVNLSVSITTGDIFIKDTDYQ